mgnify:CR=1 FL=1
MSVYTFVEGVGKYRTRVLLERAKKVLLEGGHLDPELSCLMTDGEPSGVIFNRFIVFPGCSYRNLDMESVLIGSSHWALWTLTDGGFEGGFMIDGAELEGMDLEEFAKTINPSADIEFPYEVKPLAKSCLDDMKRLYEAMKLPHTAPFPTMEEFESFSKSNGELDIYWDYLVLDYFKCVMYAKYYDVIRPTLKVFHKGFKLWRKLLEETKKGYKTNIS